MVELAFYGLSWSFVVSSVELLFGRWQFKSLIGFQRVWLAFASACSVLS